MNEFAYVARKPCGCVIGVTVEASASIKQAACDLARWRRKGFSIERMTVEAARELQYGCRHEKRPATAEPFVQESLV